MTITAKERANLLMYSSVITSISLLIAFIIPLTLLPERGNPYSIKLFIVVMIFLAYISAIIIFLSSYYLKENKYTQMEDTLPVMKGIKETFKRGL